MLTLQNTLWIVQACERIISPLGWHVALGGSVLYNGESTNDLDLFFYKHKTRDTATKSSTEVLKALEVIQIGQCIPRNHGKYGDDKEVYQCYLEKVKLNIFFL